MLECLKCKSKVKEEEVKRFGTDNPSYEWVFCPVCGNRDLELRYNKKQSTIFNKI